MSWTDINKTSAQSAVTEFIDNLEDWVLTPDEKINEAPSSFTSLLASTLGKISAYSNFNMLMAKREITPSTAVLAKSLLSQLKNEDLEGIYGTPAQIQLIVSYPLQEIINRSVQVSSGKYKLTLNKNTSFVFGNKPSFTLDYNIDIYTTKYTKNGETKYSTYAIYDTDDKEAGNIISVSNPYLNSRSDVYIDGKQMFSMYIDTKQFVRTIVDNDMTGEPTDLSINYTDNLMGFVVLYKAQSSNTFVKVDTFLEGNDYSKGLGYTLTNNGDNKNIRLRFSKLPDSFNPTNGIIRVVVYTTSGSKGNFTLGQVDENTSQDMDVAFNQNIADESQYALLNIIPTCTLIGEEATGGKDALDLEGIRDLVIQSGKGEVITPTSLANKANKAGFSVFKKRHDLSTLEYTLSSFLTDSKGYIVPSKFIDGYFAFSDIDVDSESNARMVTPSDSFSYDSSRDMYKYIPNNELEVYKNYYAEYKKDSSKEQYTFPYFIRIQNGDSLDVDIYDESVNETRNLQFTYVSDNIYDKASIVSMFITRNPISMTEISSSDDDTEYEKDFYKIAFDVHVGDVIYDHLKAIHDRTSSEEAYLKFKVVLKNRSDGSLYTSEVDISDATFDDDTTTINCFVYLKTSSAVLSDGKINICDNSIRSIPYTGTQYNFYYIDGAVDVGVVVLFKVTDDSDIISDHSEYLTSAEVKDDYYVGIIYNTEKVVLAKDISQEIDITSDLKLTQPVYEYAEQDIPDTYSENVYKTDSSNNYEVTSSSETLPDGTVSSRSSYTKLHSAGDVKQELDGRVGTLNTLFSNSDWKWSDESTSTGVYDAGNVLGGEAIYAIAQWNNLVIFAGEDGRVGCYDITYSKWHAYNESSENRLNYRNPSAASPEESGYVIKGSSLLGTYTDNGVTKICAIRGLKIVYRNKQAVLIAYGDLGRVVSCRLANNSWNKHDGSKQNSDGAAIYYNNGGCINSLNETNSLYACEEYTYSTTDSNGSVTEHNNLVFAGGSGRICSLTLDDGNAGWHNYNSDEGDRGRDAIFSDGSVVDYKTILSISKYLENTMYFTGINGISSIADLTTGEISLLNNGDVVDNKTMYASCISGNLFIQAGKDGYISSYNITKGLWTNYNSGSGLCSDGSYIDGADIYAVLPYSVDILFCGEYGRISVYDTTNNSWEAYNSSSENALTNNGDFIKSTISCISFDTENGNNLIYFGGKAGNISYKYRKGDIIYDDNGNPKIKEGSKQLCYLKGIPAYSRLYAVESNYFNIVDSYNTFIDKISAMDNIFVDEGNLYLGVKTTSGTSKTYYFTPNKSLEKEYLDSLAIGLKLGVKFDDNITSDNAEFLVSSIKSEIVEYVKNLQNNSSYITEFNINKMLDTIKDSVPSISYFEYYGLNDYSSSDCQTIYHENTADDKDNEYLCIQTVIDENNSDIAAGNVVFIPNISLVIL